jgi:hypothetical protein
VFDILVSDLEALGPVLLSFGLKRQQFLPYDG